MHSNRASLQGNGNIEDAARDLRETLLQIPGFLAVGIGADSLGETILVYVKKTAKLASGAIPKTFYGYRVEVIRTQPPRVA
jgi:hypothetical protein